MCIPQILIRAALYKNLVNTHVHDANEAISTRSAGYDAQRKTACPRVRTSVTALYSPNCVITSSEWMMT